VAALAAEGQLTASALIPLREQELAEALKLVSALVLDPDQVQGDGQVGQGANGDQGNLSRRFIGQTDQGHCGRFCLGLPG